MKDPSSFWVALKASILFEGISLDENGKNPISFCVVTSSVVKARSLVTKN